MSETLLLADADVLIHFLKGQQLPVLPKIFSNKLVLLDAVVVELKQGRNIYGLIKQQIGEHIEEISFDEKQHVRSEWGRLIGEDVGLGESACLAFARYEGH